VSDHIGLHWTIKSAGSITGFNIHRSDGGIGRFRRINTQIIPPESGSHYVDDDIVPGHTYFYRVGVVESEREWFSRTISITVPSATPILFQNYPNPFNPTTTISFELSEKVFVNLTVYNVDGKPIRTVVNGPLDSGIQEVYWDGINANGISASSGVYFYRLKAGVTVLTKKMVLLD
jgi:hypothetical protein